MPILQTKHKNRFVNDRIEGWEKLEELLRELNETPLRLFPRPELKKFGELYRRAAADLAVARSEAQNPKLVNYLNSLVIRAHGKIYRAEGQGWKIIKDFFLHELPQVFRKRIAYFLVSTALFWIPAIFSFLLSYTDKNFVAALDLSDVQLAAINNEKWWESLNRANQVGAARILTNNIQVTLMSFAYGVFLGLGTIYVLILNGLFIGGVFGACYAVNPSFANELATFVVGHGVIELSCISIGGASGLMIGHSIISPGEYKRTDAIKLAATDAIRLMLGCAFFLVVAGIIEGFVSPSSLPASAKFGIGLLSGILLYSYLFLVGRENKRETE